MADYAIIQAGGNQLKVSTGQTVRLEKLAGEPGAEVVFDSVLLLSAGGSVSVGRPFVSGAKVRAQIIGPTKGKKIRAYRFTRKTGFQRTQGHRQDYTSVKITEVVAG